MELPGMVTASLEQALNALLQLDPRAKIKLARLHGQVVAIELYGVDLMLYFVADETGQLQISSQHEVEADAVISGSLLDLIRATDTHEGSAQLFSGDMKLTGDTDLAHRFSSVLGGLDIDWEEQLSRVTGDVAAHQIGRTARRLQASARDNSDTLTGNIGEYLTEEARFLPPRLEMEEYLSLIDTLRDDTARLEARIQRLQQQAGKSS